MEMIIEKISILILKAFMLEYLFKKSFKYRWNGGNSSVWRYGWRLLWPAHEAPKSLVSG